MVEVSRFIASQIRKTHDKGCKIGLVRDLALALDCDPEVVADLQGHYECKKEQLAKIK